MKGRAQIGSQFIAHRVEMRESVAWHALPDDARRILDRLEVEHMRHGGAENGSLKQTYGQFHAAGVRRSSISRAIRQCETLGFLKVQKFGYTMTNSLRPANRYLLTYIVGRGKSPKPTDDWNRINTFEQAQAALQRAEGSTQLRVRTGTHQNGVPPRNIDSRAARGSG